MTLGEVSPHCHPCRRGGCLLGGDVLPARCGKRGLGTAGHQTDRDRHRADCCRRVRLDREDREPLGSQPKGGQRDFVRGPEMDLRSVLGDQPILIIQRCTRTRARTTHESGGREMRRQKTPHG